MKERVNVKSERKTGKAILKIRGYCRKEKIRKEKIDERIERKSETNSERLK